MLTLVSPNNSGIRKACSSLFFITVIKGNKTPWPNATWRERAGFVLESIIEGSQVSVTEGGTQSRDNGGTLTAYRLARIALQAHEAHLSNASRVGTPRNGLGLPASVINQVSVMQTSTQAHQVKSFSH